MTGTDPVVCVKTGEGGTILKNFDKLNNKQKMDPFVFKECIRLGLREGTCRACQICTPFISHCTVSYIQNGWHDKINDYMLECDCAVIKTFRYNGYYVL